MEKRLYKSKTDKMVDGVCGGIAKYFNVDPTLIRVAYAILSFFGGFFIGGIILYIILAIIIPIEP
jgi:phage shock protein C